MPGSLSDDLVAAYWRDGFLFPLDALRPDEAGALRLAVERTLARAGEVGDVSRYTFGAPHLVIREVAELAADPRLLDAVESVLGPDIMLWDAGFFIKEPRTTDFVSWHQDLRYWGLSDEAHELTVWVAVGDVTPENGAMRFIPGSHASGLKAHRDTWKDDNQLSRGQVLDVEVDESKAVTAALRAGQISLHHGGLFHASGANRTDSRRIGLAIRYIRPDMRQIAGPVDYARLVRGEDRFGHFRPEPEPAFDFEPGRLAAIDAMLRDTDAYFYAGVEERAPSREAPAG